MICSRCGNDKKIDDFRQTIQRGKPYVVKRCKTCENKYHKKQKKGYYKPYFSKAREELSDAYIRQCLKIYNVQIPKSLIELKKQLLILKKNIYEINQRCNPNGNRYEPEAIGRYHKSRCC